MGVLLFSYYLFNPDLHGEMATRKLSLFDDNRTRLETEFRIRDEAEWRLFCEAFDRGFVKGYPKVEEGITMRSAWKKISLFDD